MSTVRWVRFYYEVLSSAINSPICKRLLLAIYVKSLLFLESCLIGWVDGCQLVDKRAAFHNTTDPRDYRSMSSCRDARPGPVVPCPLLPGCRVGCDFGCVVTYEVDSSDQLQWKLNSTMLSASWMS